MQSIHDCAFTLKFYVKFSRCIVISGSSLTAVLTLGTVSQWPSFLLNCNFLSTKSKSNIVLVRRRNNKMEDVNSER
jgi:hypothetical protein